MRCRRSFCYYGYTVLGQLKIYNKITRSSFSLPDSERVVLLFILDRTIGWQNVWARIATSEFIKGVRRRRRGRNFVVVSGTSLMPQQLEEALASLKERGAIEICGIGRRVCYKIAEDWCHPDLQGSGMWELNEGDYAYIEDIGGTKRLLLAR